MRCGLIKVSSRRGRLKPEREQHRKDQKCASSGNMRTLFPCFRAAAHNFKGCVLSTAVGGRAASCYQQKCEGTQYSEPKHIRINQRLGTLIWKHEMPYIKLGLADTPTHDLNKLVRAHTSPCVA